MQAVLITPNGPDGSWWQGLKKLPTVDHHDNPTRDRVTRSTGPAVFFGLSVSLGSASTTVQLQK